MLIILGFNIAKLFVILQSFFISSKYSFKPLISLFKINPSRVEMILSKSCLKPLTLSYKISKDLSLKSSEVNLKDIHVV